MKLMSWQADANTKLGFIFGLGGAVYKMILNVHLPIDDISKFVENVITAGVCGFIGVAGKDLWLLAKRSFKTYFKTGKKK
jgi:site-specific recombinase